MILFSARHFKRTVLVTVVIGVMWYMYATKDPRSGTKEETRREETLTLQDRMQEVLAARQWLAQNSAKMSYALPGTDRDPNLFFNNAPPRTVYGDAEQKPLWGRFMGGSGDLENFRRGEQESNNPDVGQGPGAGSPTQQAGVGGEYGQRPRPADANPYVPQSGVGYGAWNSQAYQNQLLKSPFSDRPLLETRGEGGTGGGGALTSQGRGYGEAAWKQQPASGSRQVLQAPTSRTKPQPLQDSPPTSQSFPVMPPPSQSQPAIPPGPQSPVATPPQSQSPQATPVKSQSLPMIPPNAQPLPAIPPKSLPPPAIPPQPQPVTSSVSNQDLDQTMRGKTQDVNAASADKVSEPSADSLQPGANSLQPAVDSFRSAADSNIPVGSGLQPMANSLQPAANSLQAAANSHQPLVNSLQPEANSFQTADDTLQTATSNLQPVVNSLQSGTNRLQPADSSLQPAANSQQPADNSLTLTANNPQPLANSHQPADSSLQPGSDPVHPAVAGFQAAAESPHQAASSLQPVADSSQPVASDPQPLADSLQPIIIKRQRRRIEGAPPTSSAPAGGHNPDQPRPPTSPGDPPPQGLVRSLIARLFGDIAQSTGYGQHGASLANPSAGAAGDRLLFQPSRQGEGQGNSDIPAIPDPVPKDPVPVAEIPIPSSINAAQPADQSGSAMSQRSALPQMADFSLLQNLRPEAVGERGGGQGDGARKAPPPPPPPAKKGPGDLQHVTMVTRDKVKWKEESCPDVTTLRMTTLRTPLGDVSLYLQEGDNVTDSEQFNHDFGLQWNWHGVGTLFDRCLLPDPNVTLVDIGAGVGAVTFTAAILRRDVYAVEPIASKTTAMCNTIRDLHHDNVHLVHNAVSNDRGKVYFKSGLKNQPTSSLTVDLSTKSKPSSSAPTANAIKLDDILRLYKITTAAVRIDTESLEGRALAGANKFLNTVHVPCILMEWKYVHALKEFGGKYVFQTLSNHGFFPHDVNTLKPLKVLRMHEWPPEVLWAKLGSAPVAA